jgi:hypothetical protein
MRGAAPYAGMRSLKKYVAMMEEKERQNKMGMQSAIVYGRL